MSDQPGVETSSERGRSLTLSPGQVAKRSSCLPAGGLWHAFFRSFLSSHRLFGAATQGGPGGARRRGRARNEPVSRICEGFSLKGNQSISPPVARRSADAFLGRLAERVLYLHAVTASAASSHRSAAHYSSEEGGGGRARMIPRRGLISSGRTRATQLGWLSDRAGRGMFRGLTVFCIRQCEFLPARPSARAIPRNRPSRPKTR